MLLDGAAAISDRVQMGQSRAIQTPIHSPTVSSHLLSCVSPNTSLFHCCPGRWAWICHAPECSLFLFHVHVYPSSIRACIHTVYGQRKSPAVFQGDILILWVIVVQSLVIPLGRSQLGGWHRTRTVSEAYALPTSSLAPTFRKLCSLCSPWNKWHQVLALQTNDCSDSPMANTETEK